MCQQVFFRNQQLAAEDAFSKSADDSQMKRLTIFILYNQFVAEAEMEDPLHRVGVAEYWDNVWAEVLIEQCPRVVRILVPHLRI